MKRILTFMAAVMLVFGVAGNALALDGIEFVINMSETNNGTMVVLDSDVTDGLSESSVTNLTQLDYYSATSYADLSISAWGSYYNYMGSSAFVAVEDIDAAIAAGGGTISSSGQTQIYNVSDLIVDETTYDYTGYTSTNINGDTISALDTITQYMTYEFDLSEFDTALANGTSYTYTYDIAYYTVGMFGVNPTVADSGYDLFISIDESGVITAGITAVPVPGALILLGSGLMALVGIRRRKN